MSISVKDVLGLAAANVGRGDLSNALTQSGNADVAEFLRCYNAVENEVGLDYFPLVRADVFAVTDGAVSAGLFPRRPVQVLRVRNEEGRRLSFSFDGSSVKVKGAKRAEIEYLFAPSAKTSVNDATEFGERISARLLAYGVSALYLLTRGAAAEASVWERKYREALRAAGLCRRTLSVRARRWV